MSSNKEEKGYLELLKFQILTTDMLWKILIAPLLLPISPVIGLFIKLQAVMKRDNELIQNQKKICSRGECSLEATPQLCLQMYITLYTLSADWKQIFSMITSGLKISFEHTTNFLDIKQLVGGKNLLKYLPVIFFNSFFRVSSLALIFIFFHLSSIFIILAYCFILFILFFVLLGFFDLRKEKTDRYEMIESMMSGWLSITNLDNTKCAKLILFISTYFNLIINSIILLSVMTKCNANPDTSFNPNDNIHWGDFTYGLTWGEQMLVRNIFYLNLFTLLSISLGLLSVAMDIMYGACGWGSVFHGAWRNFHTHSMSEGWSNFKNYLIQDKKRLQKFGNRKSDKNFSDYK